MDSLRTWLPCVLLDRMGLRAPAGVDPWLLDSLVAPEGRPEPRRARRRPGETGRRLAASDPIGGQTPRSASGRHRQRGPPGTGRGPGNRRGTRLGDCRRRRPDHRRARLRGGVQGGSPLLGPRPVPARLPACSVREAPVVGFGGVGGLEEMFGDSLVAAPYPDVPALVERSARCATRSAAHRRGSPGGTGPGPPHRRRRSATVLDHLFRPQRERSDDVASSSLTRRLVPARRECSSISSPHARPSPGALRDPTPGGGAVER